MSDDLFNDDIFIEHIRDLLVDSLLYFDPDSEMYKRMKGTLRIIDAKTKNVKDRKRYKKTKHRKTKCKT